MFSCQCSYSCCLFKQKTAYELRISDWSSDVCSSDLSRFSGKFSFSLPAGAVKADFSASGEGPAVSAGAYIHTPSAAASAGTSRGRKSVVEGKSVSVRVALGGRRISKNKTMSNSRRRHNNRYNRRYITVSYY